MNYLRCTTIQTRDYYRQNAATNNCKCQTGCPSVVPGNNPLLNWMGEQESQYDKFFHWTEVSQLIQTCQKTGQPVMRCSFHLQGTLVMIWESESHRDVWRNLPQEVCRTGPDKKDTVERNKWCFLLAEEWNKLKMFFSYELATPGFKSRGWKEGGN